MPVTSSNEKRFSQQSARSLACEILTRVDSQQAYADVLLDHKLRTSALKQADRALLTELTYGTLRWRGAVDALLEPLLHQGLASTAPLIRNLLRMTIYQIVYLDKIPAYAAVNEAVDLASASNGTRAGGFVNGVLRSFLRQKSPFDKNLASNDSVQSLGAAFSHPQWLLERWTKAFGNTDAKQLMAANNQPAPLVVRANCTKTSVE